LSAACVGRENNETASAIASEMNCFMTVPQIDEID
jgi:hypothetical protein